MLVAGQPIAQRPPGVYREEAVRRSAPLPRTGVPALLGFTRGGRAGNPILVTRRADARRWVGEPSAEAFLACAVDGFFLNGGRACYVVPLARDADPENALAAGLEALEARGGGADLLCAPDLTRHGWAAAPSSGDVDRILRLQATLLASCGSRTGRFAILDALPAADTDLLTEQRRRLSSADGALYHPWIRVRATREKAGAEPPLVPPCGHVAGVFARVDEVVGVHKAPANEGLAAVVDLERPVTAELQGRLNPLGINCLRSFPGRGIRIWGARTLSGQPTWRYVNVRRLLLTVERLLKRDLAPFAFEPHGPELWPRVRHRVVARLTELFQKGAFRGPTPRDAFYVKCDAETNPPASRAAGRIVTEIGLAPNGPAERVVVRLVQDARGMTFQEPRETG